MSVSDFVKFATTLPPERVDGQPKASKQDSFLADAIRQHGIPITITDYETGVEEEPLPKKAAGDGLGKYSEDQPRDEKGRFSGSGASNAESAKTSDEHARAAEYHSAKAQELHDKSNGTSYAAILHDKASAFHEYAAQHGAKSQDSHQARDLSVRAHKQEAFENQAPPK